MLKRCKVCRGTISNAVRNTKYCAVCKKNIQKLQQKTWNKSNYTPKRNLIFCIKCFNKLPANSNSDRKYCTKCLNAHRKIIKKQSYKEKRLVIN